MKLLPISFGLAWLLLLPAHGQIIAPGATVQKLAGNFLFTEGAASDAEGNVYFTDQPNDRIMKWSVDGQLSTFLQPAGRSNGLCFDAQNNLWACADEKNELWCIDPVSKKIQVILKDYEGKALNGPNDLWFLPDGSLYFTDPYYQRPWWTRKAPDQDKAGVYFLAAPEKSKAYDHGFVIKQKLPVRVADDMEKPNGIIGTPDGKILYVTDIGAQKTYRYKIQPDGSLTDKTLFCEMGSDGMTLDDKGNVYLTNKGVTVFDPSGKQIEHIDVPGEPWVGNVCFGARDRKTLFIAASKGFYSLRMEVSGVGSQ